MRFRISALAALVIPAALAAQQPATAPANPITQSFRAVSGRFGGFLMAAFDSIPASKYDYKPTPVQQSIGHIAQHLEDANYQLCVLMGGSRGPTTARDSLADTVKAKWPKDTLVARLKASFTFCDNATAKLDDARLGDDVAVGPPSAGRKATRARFLFLFATDLSEHYAQLASYMRLMGMVPPSSLPRR